MFYAFTKFSSTARSALVAGAVLLGSLATMVGFAPSASADVLSDITATSSPAANFQLEKKNLDNSFTAVPGKTATSTTNASFTDLAAGTYRVAVSNPDCNPQNSTEVAVDGTEADDDSIPVVNLVCDFVPLTPKRVLETRATGAAPGVTRINPVSTVPAEQTGKTSANGGVGSIYKVDVTSNSSGVPTGALAIAANVTATEVSGEGNYITVWDCSDAVNADDTFEPDPPNASNLNVTNGGTRPNAVISKVGTGDELNRICIFSLRSSHLIVDITGYFPGGATGATNHMTFKAPGPERVLETRPNSVTPPITTINWGGGKPPANFIHKINVGPGRTKAILNVTGVDGTGGHVTVWDCEDTVEGSLGLEPDPPTASSLNLENNVTSANLVVVGSSDGSTVPASATGDVCLYASVSTHLVVDVIGTFKEASNYKAVLPRRVLETRPLNVQVIPNIVPTPLGTTKPGNGTVTLIDLDQDPDGGGPLTAPIGEANAKAAILNITGLDSPNDNFVTVYPCNAQGDARPNASTLNLVVGEARPNAAIVGLNGGKVCIFNNRSAHLIADLVGYFPG